METQKNSWRTDLAQNLKALRKSKNLHQSDLAKASGVAVRTVISIEKGEGPGPNVGTVAALAEVLEVQLGVLLSENLELKMPKPTAKEALEVLRELVDHQTPTAKPDITRRLAALDDRTRENVLKQIEDALAGAEIELRQRAQGAGAPTRQPSKKAVKSKA